MNQKPLVGAHLAGDLNACFFLDPVEHGFDGLANLRDGARKPDVGNVERLLAFLPLDRRHHLERQPARPLEVVISLVGVDFLVGQRGGNLFKCGAVVQSRRSQADEARTWQRTGLSVADQVDFHAVIVKVLSRAVAAAGQFGGALGVVAAALPGHDHRHGVGPTPPWKPRRPSCRNAPAAAGNSPQSG